MKKFVASTLKFARNILKSVGGILFSIGAIMLGFGMTLTSICDMVTLRTIEDPGSSCDFVAFFTCVKLVLGAFILTIGIEFLINELHERKKRRGNVL